jgi:conjugative transposon TraM protein
MQENIGEASQQVQKSGLSDKLDAFRNQYKDADGATAINAIAEEPELDSIDREMKNRFASPSGLPYATGQSFQQESASRLNAQDQALANALANLNRQGEPQKVNGYQATVSPKEKDPMELFKAQMVYMDSVSRLQDPEYKAEQERLLAIGKAEREVKDRVKLEVRKASDQSALFNTLLPGKPADFIKAIIDENITGYASSRIRLRLLENVNVGKTTVKKGAYLYAEIDGFSGQRVSLSIKSIFTDGKILPVKLDLFDIDGLAGLYVPESAFREFTKDLGGNSMQGVNIQGTSQNQSQFLMSTIDKMFQSTSSAIASLIRKNKAKLKYSYYVYLIDPEALQNEQKNY